MKFERLALMLTLLLYFSSAGYAKDFSEEEKKIAENPHKEAFFGETHMHTSMSLDALIGMVSYSYLRPDDAYQLAKGETLVVSGMAHNIGRPLDFAAVTDHAEYTGESYSATVKGAPGYNSAALQSLRAADTFEKQIEWYDGFSKNQRSATGPTHPDYYAGRETSVSAWKLNFDATEAHYEPGKFTTLHAFEWSSVVKGGNMHRNVIFRDAVVPDAPYSAIDSTDETKLWAWMKAQEEGGSTLFAIPHNSNASKGFMFSGTYPDGRPFDAEYATTRNRYERLVEIHQIKGNSEVARSLWPADEFAGFENATSLYNYAGRKPLPQNFVRWALGKGLAYSELGANPYQLGFIGGTDNHNGTMSDVVESNFIGGHGPADNTVQMRRNGEVPAWAAAKDINPGSIAGVWATKNTRGAIYDAMYSRETFSTSGPRIKPRFFCGLDLHPVVSDVDSMLEDGYTRGVPMGGTLKAGKGSMVCTVAAVKDPEGANLDRIQIVKSWIGENGEPMDKVYDVVWSGGRKRRDDGSVPAVGNTVDLGDASFTNDIGAPQLIGYWEDPAFDAAKGAVYYARVIEIPTPRWTTFDAVRAGLPLLDDAPATIQERAWTSPIWYSPSP